ncbi:hypothetical protein A3I46_01640 [Candidatus Kaiserbacteria bacterium RIFCSPLOWO2_02_FULL_54_13]|uniref:Uncharacterized protein n=1 Tax=Candidatus Kaiserbacteria bacterium RIFCSPHIGHO2_02_FULL_54_22 TaxID=1798495 RepID=A0A1F6DNJ9_9BACT|nr:MAG: hypothetical protein UY89_C0008G0006 [Parcubacteria group bacterium GW2011_GWA1_54_9]KKW41568.1 MAG: hypothetical protein UY91_C0014G0005 [Parcubacteria group bacterium GW2011_GWB1_55_9]OGG62897.1 MAG: hypothetical protein A3C19_02120 [Candidatus Kaiserbacteria bacterium RIFCSPHIGHO2_02_FULL_54_22]OGG68050.1 MAG: hypothetical protein A3E99_02105 [Candidatus Kaiserbacteria bacterium RIFCSPHIGHO2_12_FULL_54_16]OGG82530.1 MAG: hypothetical protein A3I46_01640 [Candidatus Kaiserbacteria bac
MKEKKYICGGDTFTYNKGYITLPVELNGLPETLSIEGETLQKRASFHVSLLCVKNILSSHPDLEEEILDLFCAFTKENKISFVAYTGEFRFAQDKERKTLVALCAVSNLKECSELLEEKLGIDIPPQPTHVTLYTLQPDAGIGLNSPAEIEGKSVSIQVSEEVRDALGL